jgi:DNA polymerase-3 subunit beta
MKFTVNREPLLHALQQTVGVAEKKTTMPILANVLVAAKDNQLTITATDLEVCLIARCAAQVSQPGSFTLPAKNLLDIVKEFPRDEIHCELGDNQQLQLISQKSQFRLVGMAAEDFPNFPTVQNLERVKIPANTLKQMIERTSFSISSDEMRYSLNGILFEAVDDGVGQIALRLVSTDGHRLSLTEHPLGAVHNAPFREKAVLPRKGVLELKRLLDDGQDEVECGFDGSNGVVTYKDTTLYMRRIVGEFPDYRKVIPEEPKYTVVVNRQEFISSLKRMMLMSSSKHKLVRFDFSSERLEMSCQNPELGTAHEEVALRYDGSPMTIGFNPKYFLDALSVIDEKEIQVGFLDELSPAIIRSKANQFKCVIMPMRL